MKYLGLDVHSSATVWCLLDEQGQVLERGTVKTIAAELEQLVNRLGPAEQLVVGQEVGSMCYFVHDVLTGTGVKLLSFNAYQLRMIASSRKKTDKRDAYWIAKALQTGMTPHPVYLPTGQVRLLRMLLSQRETVLRERKRWLLRAKAYLRAAGHTGLARRRSVMTLLESTLAQPEGMDAELAEALERCGRMHATLTTELREIEGKVRREAGGIDAIERLQTIPSVGPWVAVTVYAWVGDVSRFPDARSLGAYAGLVPSVRNSGASKTTGAITKQGPGPLRTMLVQAGHTLLFRCAKLEALPLRAIAQRIHTARARRKIAVVAAARHVLRLCYYLLRDGTRYDPTRLQHAQVTPSDEPTKSAA